MPRKKKRGKKIGRSWNLNLPSIHQVEKKTACSDGLWTYDPVPASRGKSVEIEGDFEIGLATKILLGIPPPISSSSSPEFQSLDLNTEEYRVAATLAATAEAKEAAAREAAAAAAAEPAKKTAARKRKGSVKESPFDAAAKHLPRGKTFDYVQSWGDWEEYYKRNPVQL